MATEASVPARVRPLAEVVATDRPATRWRQRETLAKVGMYALVILMALIVLFPISWMVSMSFKTPREINRVPALVPQVWTLDNDRELILERDFLTAIGDSAIIAISVTLISLAIASLAAYSQVRFRYRFRGFLGRIILFG